MESGPLLFAVGAITLVILMAYRGWRLGLVRQALSIVALAVAYAAGWFLGGYLIPVLRPLGYPDRVLTLFGAVLVGIVVYAVLTIAVAVVFKRTEHQSVGVVKVIFGLPGALLGAVFGLFLAIVCAVAVRLIGTVAEAEKQPHPTAARIVALKRSFEHGAAGALMDSVDLVPGAVYRTLGNIGLLASSPEGIERFATDRDVRRVSAHPKILALRDDPEVQRALREGDYFSLLRHPKLVDAANDPDVMRLLGTFDLQKALDRAVPSPQKPSAR